MATGAEQVSSTGADDIPLVVSSYTLGLDVPFPERVRVAAEAGFAGIGLRAENYWDARSAGLDDAAMLEILDSHGVAVMEVEYLTEWGTESERDAAQRAKEETVFHLARTFGVAHMNAGLVAPVPPDGLVDAFRGLCRRAGELTVALEFLPYGGVPDLPTAWQLVRDAGESNGALVLDAWHRARSGMSDADLAAVPADRIVSIQLCDVLEHPMTPLRLESLHHRLPPGRGYGDVDGMLRAVRSKGVRPWVIAVEVINDDLLDRGLETTARTVIAAAREVLGRSWVAPPVGASSSD
jgi:sugar phosphate isomerase/epimerase